MQEPDVSEVSPVDIDTNEIRSDWLDVVYINDYTRYQAVKAYWHDVDKCFYRSDGSKIQHEIVRTQ